MVQFLKRMNRGQLVLSGIASICASVSILALLIHATGWLPMYFLVDLLAAPSLILLLALGAIAQRINQPVFLDRLIVGAWGGLVATFAYDLTRLGLWQSGLIDFDPFLSHPIFGSMITGLAETTSTAIIVGWAYHFWNGFGFGIIYTLVAGPANWGYALLWALFLEAGWLTALPSILEFRLNPQLIVVSLIGHAAYGMALGFVAQKVIRE
jgi:hypothetical protein